MTKKPKTYFQCMNCGSLVPRDDLGPFLSEAICPECKCPVIVKSRLKFENGKLYEEDIK